MRTNGKHHQDMQSDALTAPAVLVIFGAGGDLAKRLLIPSLYNLAAARKLPKGFRIVAIDRDPVPSPMWADRLFAQISEIAKDPAAEFHCDALDRTVWDVLMDRVTYIGADFTSDLLYPKIREVVGAENAIFYLAVPARFFGAIGSALGKAGLLQEGGFYRRLIVEKPFGSDLASARALDETLLGVMREDQIYRIDHFLGKETVQGIMAARFSNPIFEALWNGGLIDHIEITAAETIGVEKRGHFYEATGALRDMVPNHLFVILAMVAMERPSSLAPDVVRDEKAKLLRAVRPVAPEDYVRAQYDSGRIGDRQVAAYRQEQDVAPDSVTETYAALRLFVDTPRWQGVPFYLRTGKRLGVRRTEVVVCFKDAADPLFRRVDGRSDVRNEIRFLLDPLRGVDVQFDVKAPSADDGIAAACAGFRYENAPDVENRVGYEGLLIDCMKGNALLFQSAAIIEACWAALETINRDLVGDIVRYAAGSSGPHEADALLARDGRAWRAL